MPQPCTRRALSLALALLLLPAPHAWTEGSSGVTPQSDQASQALDLPDLRGKAPEGTFTAPGEAPFRSDTAYRSENVALTLTRTRDEESRSNVIVADVWVSSVQYLRRGFSENKWRGGMRSMRTIAPDAGAVLAITGDYAAELSAGPVVANGEIYRKNQNRLRDNCLILRDGRMLTYCRGTLDVAEALRGEVWHSSSAPHSSRTGRRSHPLTPRSARPTHALPWATTSRGITASWWWTGAAPRAAA